MIEEYENVQLDNETDSLIFKFYSKDTNRIIPMHFHKEVEVLYCVTGELKIWINGSTLYLTEGEMFFINSAVPHATQSMEKSEVIVLYLSDAVFKEEEVSVKFDQKYYDTKPYKRTTEMIRNIYSAAQISERFQKYYSKSLILQLEYFILTHFSETIETQRIEQMNNNKKIRHVLTIIQKHFQENLSLEELSEKSGYSMHYLSRKFHKSTGMTFSEYKKSLCLEMTIKLIDETSLSLEEISIQSGFPNEKSMRTYFKKVMGENPSVYRMSNNDRNKIK